MPLINGRFSTPVLSGANQLGVCIMRNVAINRIKTEKLNFSHIINWLIRSACDYRNGKLLMFIQS